jgi:hypothetical protein
MKSTTPPNPPRIADRAKVICTIGFERVSILVFKVDGSGLPKSMSMNPGGAARGTALTDTC